MFRHAPLIGIATCAVLVACGNESTLSQVDAELEVSPSLTDLGTVPVGIAEGFVIQIDHAKGGPIKIKNITVTDIEGEGVFTLVGDTTAEVSSSDEEGLKVPFEYLADDTGYHRAKIEIVHNGKDSPATVDVRAHAVLPEATVWPLGLDFGPVDPGSSSSRQLTVSNQSDLDLTISDFNISNPVFGLVTAIPFTVGGGDELVVQLEFVPSDTTAQQGTLTLRAGDVPLPQVGLRGNDCENGDPEAYDQDGDGYTLCGGDCDDMNFDVKPGAIEIGNGIDDNCDGTADEGTELYDDDGDGFCEGPGACTDGTVVGDCSDSGDPAVGTDLVNPDATEILDNGIDDDCDGVVDQGTTDADGDGYSPAGGDCDDLDATVYPGAPELADFLNNDCDGFTDEGTVYYDDDGDGYCEDATTCSDGSLTGDCDDDIVDADGIGGPDGRPTNPGATEQPDFRDNDCDGIVDEGTDNYDNDGDGYTVVGGDCDDTAADNDGDGVPDGAAFSPALGNC